MNEKQYTKQAMLMAMQAVLSGVSASSAAKEFGVPRTTLLDKVTGRSTIDSTKGPSTILTKQEEENLKNWLIYMADHGFPISKEKLLDSVCLLIKKLNRKNPFRNDRPGRHWYEAFIKRYPEVGERVAQNLTQSRAAVTEEKLRLWFKEVEEYFVATQLKEALDNPRQIFNCDESAFFLSPTDNKVLAKRGSKNVYNVIQSGEKECVTVLITANAAGELAPPMVLYKLKSIPLKISSTTPNGWGLGCTPKGWMTGESFYEYMTNVFYPWAVNNHIPLPILFFLDGHCSHTTLPLSNFCREKNMILISLYPNATHLLQPMDVAVFRPLKQIWKKVVYEWRNQNQFKKLKKENVCPLLNDALQQLDKNVITNGFRKCGLSPFNPDSVDYTKCIKRTQQKQASNDNYQIDQSEKQNHFKFFESQISPSKLKAFHDNKSPNWMGDKSLEGLFTVWRQMKTVSSRSDDHDVDRKRDESRAHVFENQDQMTKNITPDKSPQRLQEVENFDVNISSLEDTNFTGFSNLMDSNYSLASLSGLNLESHVDSSRQLANEGQVELYEVIEGKLNKVNHNSNEPIYSDIPIYFEPLELLNSTLKKDSETRFTKESPSMPEINVMRTTGSKPIYLTPRSDISKVNLSNVSPSADLKNNPNISPRPNKPKVTPTITSSKTLTSDVPSPFKDIPTPFKDALFWPESPSTNVKTKVKIPSVITSDRWQIFAQKKQENKIKREKEKVEAKERKIAKSKNKIKTEPCIPKKKTLSSEPKGDWYCPLCESNKKMDMIECLGCKLWYHTLCAKVQPTDISFYCTFCNV